MKIIVVLTMICLPFLLMAQDSLNSGIKWTTVHSWNEVKQLAKQQNKFIFVDCFTTWCAPCKLMDKEVYPKDNVGSYMNDKFISVRIQMDTSANDDEAIINLYKDAHELQVKYKVFTFPTLLFFTPNGTIVHRFSGAVNDKVLISIAERALDPERQFYTLLEKYKLGKKEFTKFKYLVRTAKEIGEQELSQQIARDYIKNYLNYQEREKLLSKIELDFIRDNFEQLTSKDKVFKFIYNNMDSINCILKYPEVSQLIISSVITREEINPIIWPMNKTLSGTPNWEKLARTIKQKYNLYYANRVILDAKLRWYNEKQDWPNIVKYNIEKVELSGPDTSGLNKWHLNNMIWAIIFKHSNKKNELNKGINWMELIIQSAPNDPTPIDTYANLLYKVGRVEDAIFWESKAVVMEESVAINQNRSPDTIYKETLEKMKKGIPTWTINQ